MTQEDKQKLAERIAEKAMSAKNVTYAVVLQAVHEALNARDEEIRQLHDVINDYSETIEKLRNPWVSVEERLPDDKQRVFICKSDGRMYCGKYNKSLKIFTTIDPSLTMWTINNVKAWMPIPEGGEGC